MTNLKRLARPTDDLVKVDEPVSVNEIQARAKDYPLLTPAAFARKYGKTKAFAPATITLGQDTYDIQVNRCTNPYCGSFGMPQERFVSMKYKPSRYKTVSGGGRNREEEASNSELDTEVRRRMMCNPIPSSISKAISLGCTTTVYSNWALADEIKRLATNSSVVDAMPDYQFHDESCVSKGQTTPFTTPEGFRRKGKSTSGSQRWQCKSCGKITNVLPSRRETFTYRQKRNEILPRFAEMIVGHTPVTRICRWLKISPSTYYDKLEWVYRRSLEFLERHESEGFERLPPKGGLWLNTDQMTYFLNNMRRRDQGKKNGYKNRDDLYLPTGIVATGDMKSRYIFRADLAYDWEVTVEDIRHDTVRLKEDHLHNYARKNDRLRFPYAPQPPTAHDSESYARYAVANGKFARREHYIQGLHTVEAYTAMAHYWLIKRMVKAKHWYFVSDDDASLITALMRVFAPEVGAGRAHHILCRAVGGRDKQDLFQRALAVRQDVTQWGEDHGYPKTTDPLEVARAYLVDQMRVHPQYKVSKVGGAVVAQPLANWDYIQYPFPANTEGERLVACTTNISDIPPEEVAIWLLAANNHVTNGFFQEIRRSIQVLERPIVGASGQKSYVYSNFNPRYAQYAVTILRTYYNFCEPVTIDGVTLTPAQHLGLTKKQFTIDDILYLK